MITNQERKQLAEKLGWHKRLTEHEMCKILNIDAWAEGEVMIDRLIELIEPQKVDGKTSDGYHTFDELYDHRAKLFAVLVSVFKNRSWKSLKHSDGTMYDGMFIVGIDTPEGSATYHYDLNYWDIFDCKEIKNAPEWDGHTPTDAINRILNMKNYILQASKCWSKEKDQCFDIAVLSCNLDKPKHEEYNSVALCGGRIRAFNEKKIDSMATVILEQAGKLYYEFDMWNKCYKDEENYYRNNILYECADIIQSVCNIAFFMGCDYLTDAMEHTYRRNELLGKYE